MRSVRVYYYSLVQMVTLIDIHGRCMSLYVHELTCKRFLGLITENHRIIRVNRIGRYLWRPLKQQDIIRVCFDCL